MTARVNSAGSTRGRPFAKGNPGKPRGARNRARLTLEGIFADQAEAVVRRVIEAALGGDTTAMRLSMDRILPARKDRHVQFELPPLETPADAMRAAAALVAGVSHGDLTPSEAADLGRLVETFTRAAELHDVAARLSALEARA